jgi:hypothetical protein
MREIRHHDVTYCLSRNSTSHPNTRVGHLLNSGEIRLFWSETLQAFAWIFG